MWQAWVLWEKWKLPFNDTQEKTCCYFPSSVDKNTAISSHPLSLQQVGGHGGFYLKSVGEQGGFYLRSSKAMCLFQKDCICFRLLLQVCTFVYGNSLRCKRQPMCFQPLPLWWYLHPGQWWFYLPVPRTIHRPKVNLYGLLYQWTPRRTDYKCNTFSVFFFMCFLLKAQTLKPTGVSWS